MRNKQVLVIGASDEYRYQNEAYEIGTYLASNNYTLITGGRGGIMEAVSRGAYENGGIVVGILPGEYIDEANDFWFVSILVRNFSHRRLRLCS